MCGKLKELGDVLVFVAFFLFLCERFIVCSARYFVLAAMCDDIVVSARFSSCVIFVFFVVMLFRFSYDRDVSVAS
ncbi:hypothetical protein CCP2SC5_380014 [Azospirillaceae bacterium]